MITRFEIIQPDEELREFVRYYWVLEGEASSEEPYHHRMLPTGCAEILIMKAGRFYHQEIPLEVFKAPNAVVSGQLSEPQDFVLDKPFQILGICLYPYSLTALTGMPADQLVNRLLPLSSLPGVEPLWNEVSIENADLPTWANSLLSLVKRSKGRASPVDQAFFQLIRSLVDKPGPSIGQLAAKHGIPVRTLQRICKKYTGYSPKALFRISRVQKILEGGAVQSMTELAYELEYYDQAHFINDFKQMTGQSPARFFKQTPDSLAWRDKGEERA